MEQLIGQLVTIVGVLVILVNIITEVVKKVYAFNNAQTLNIFVTILSVVMTVSSFIAYWQIKGMALTWYIIAAFIIIGFMVAYAAMFGFDKLLKYFEGTKS